MTSAFAPGRWSARWIWAPDAPVSGRHSVALRYAFELDEAPADALARACADSRYVLWVNSTEAARGPVRINPRRRRWDEIDLAEHLTTGRNVVAVLACFDATANPWWMPAPTLASRIRAGGFLFEANIDGAVAITTGEQWRALALDGWTTTTPTEGPTRRGREVTDLRSLPRDWTALDFDDATWPSARELSGATIGEPGRPEPPNYPHGPYGASPISPLGRVDVELEQASSATYHAGRLVAGTVVLDLEGPSGSEVMFTASEFVGPDGAIAPGAEPVGGTIVLDGGCRAAETFDTYGLSALRVDTPDDVTVHGVRVRERLYPVTGDASFECSDERLNQIWTVGRRTVTLCSFDAYVDCPTREQRAWVGDAVVHQMVDLTTNFDWGLARWYPTLAAEPGPDGMLPMAVAGDAEHSSFAVIPDWALHWIHAVTNLKRYVGDREEIRRLAPVVEGVLRWFDPFIDDDGLLVDVVGWVIIDWASVYTEGASGALNGLWGRALLDFAEIAEWLGDDGRTEWARRTHARLREGFERLWDPERGRYVDSTVNGRRRPMASQHTQAAAIVGGLAPEQRWPRMVEVLTDERALVHATFGVPDGEATPGLDVGPGGPYLRDGHPDPWWDVDRQVVRAQPFFRYVVHDAVAHTGRTDLIPALCLDWTQALERCESSWTETWFGGTVSHGWSSTPTRDLMVHVLGVQPAEAGFGIARIDPSLGYLDWARGTVPCPSGGITVEATRDLLVVDSPVPFVHGGERRAAGQHTIEITRA